jgi:hypothetical protein
MASNISAVGTGGSPPQSVENITKIAQDYDYNAAVPLRYWLRTAATLIREVRIPHSRVRIEELTCPACLGTNLRTRRTRRASVPPPLPTCPACPGTPNEPSGRRKG